MIQSILIVEDDPDAQMLVSHIMSYLNISFEMASDAETALARLDNPDTIYQAMIIDLQLPGKDGFELIGKIRSNPANEALICIAVTAHHTAKTRDLVLQSGFNAYFAKPLDATHFVNRLNALLPVN